MHVGPALGLGLLGLAFVVGFIIGTWISKRYFSSSNAIMSPEAKQRMERYLACIQAQLEAQGLTLNDWFSDPEGPQKISQEQRAEIENVCSLTMPQKRRA